MKLIGIVLIVLGLAGVAYGGISWTRQKNVVDLGPVQVTHDKTESIPIPPVIGVVCLVAGAVVLANGSRRAA
jgi:uncharacterized membrane protein YidH (DUF202 family)